MELIVIGLISLMVLVILTMSVRIVPEYRRLVIFRLGRCLGAKGRG